MGNSVIRIHSQVVDQVLLGDSRWGVLCEVHTKESFTRQTAFRQCSQRDQHLTSNHSERLMRKTRVEVKKLARDDT